MERERDFERDVLDFLFAPPRRVLPLLRVVFRPVRAALLERVLFVREPELERRFAAAFFPPFLDAERFGFFPRPLPLFFPPPSSLLIVA